MTKELKNRILENKVLTHDKRMEIIKALEQETVSKEIYCNEHFARKQAEYELWKIKEQQPSEDCVSREQALLALTGTNLGEKSADELIALFDKRMRALPPVTPTHGTCKDCKKYRNSLEHCTQWVMPTNDDFYCADYEKAR